jgi:hypothetical protein
MQQLASTIQEQPSVVSLEEGGELSTQGLDNSVKTPGDQPNSYYSSNTRLNKDGVGAAGGIATISMDWNILEKSEVYIANGNNKLFLALPIDELVISEINHITAAGFNEHFGMNESLMTSVFSQSQSQVTGSAGTPGSGVRQAAKAERDEAVAGASLDDNSSIESGHM